MAFLNRLHSGIAILENVNKHRYGFLCLVLNNKWCNFEISRSNNKRRN